MSEQVVKAGEKTTAAPAKPKTCHRCQALVMAKFCGSCGTEVLSPEEIDGSEWKHGSPKKKLCEIPAIVTLGGQKIDLQINGTTYQGEMYLTFDEFDAIKVLARKRMESDFNSRFGEPGTKREINFNFTVSGGQRASGVRYSG